MYAIRSYYAANERGRAVRTRANVESIASRSVESVNFFVCSYVIFSESVGWQLDERGGDGEAAAGQWDGTES